MLLSCFPVYGELVKVDYTIRNEEYMKIIEDQGEKLGFAKSGPSTKTMIQNTLWPETDSINNIITVLE